MMTSTSSATDSSDSAAPPRFERDFLRRYLTQAPLPLALERACEAEILSRQRFERPVLDLGCGDGIFASILFRDPVDLGVDINPRELEAARRMGAHRELLECSGAAVPRPTGSFRTVFSNSVLEHIPELPSVLDEVRRLLAPDGRFYATVPTDNFERFNVVFQALSAVGSSALAERWRGRFNAFWRHYHTHDLAGWRALFAAHGFEVEEAHEYCPRSLCLLNDALVPFAGPALVNKRLLNRWVLWQTPRTLSAAVLGRALAPLTAYRPGLVGGGIVFFALRPSTAQPGEDPNRRT